MRHLVIHNSPRGEFNFFHATNINSQKIHFKSQRSITRKTIFLNILFSFQAQTAHKLKSSNENDASFGRAKLKPT